MRRLVHFILLLFASYSYIIEKCDELIAVDDCMITVYITITQRQTTGSVLKHSYFVFFVSASF